MQIKTIAILWNAF